MIKQFFYYLIILKRCHTASASSFSNLKVIYFTLLNFYLIYLMIHNYCQSFYKFIISNNIKHHEESFNEEILLL